MKDSLTFQTDFWDERLYRGTCHSPVSLSFCFLALVPYIIPRIGLLWARGVELL